MIAALLRDKEDIGAKSPHLSHSQINRYLTCPEQYRLYYIEKLRAKVPSATLVFGQVIHQALAGLFKKASDPVEHFRVTWKALENIPLEFSQRDSWESLKNRGDKLLSRFLDQEFSKISGITAVEERFQLGITTVDLPFVGIIDLVATVNGRETVVDFKTAGSAYDAHEAPMSDQLSAYKLARPAIEHLALCVLVKTKEPQIAWHFTRRTGEHLAEYIGKMGYIAHEITDGRFYKRPGMWCSWCDFLPHCLGDRRKVEESLVKIQ